MAEPTNELLATYADPDAARAAIAALERHGVDAEHIRLLDAPGVGAPRTGAAERRVEHAAMAPVARRGFGMSILVAVIAAAVGGLVALMVSGGEMMPTVGAAAGFFMAGGAIGFFYGGASALSVSQEMTDTYEAHGRTTVAVHVPRDDTDDVLSTLRDTEPLDLAVA
jgi:hypothetical protein